MSQMKSFTWTNPNPAVARNLDVGFTVTEITIVDTTNGGSWYWNSNMASGSILDVDAGTITGTNGVTPLAQNAMFGGTITNFTSANPGVVTLESSTQASRFIAGDVVKITDIAESGAGTSKNGNFTVASVSGANVTLTANTTGYKTYVSGGYMTLVTRNETQLDGSVKAVPQPIDNFAIRGVTLGTSAVGGNSAVMTAVVRGEEHVT